MQFLDLEGVKVLWANISALVAKSKTTIDNTTLVKNESTGVISAGLSIVKTDG